MKRPTIIHVNRQMIAANKGYGVNALPIYSVKRQGMKTMYAYSVTILGASTLVDPRSNKPLPCGATAWIETYCDVHMVGPMTFDEVKRLAKKVEKDSKS